MGNVYAADLGDRMIAITLEQPYHNVAEIMVIEQQAAHIRRIFMFNVEEASGRRLSVRNNDRLEHSDFASGVFVWLPAYPGPRGGPAPHAVIRHQGVVSQR
jgi:hypothetical protein